MHLNITKSFRKHAEAVFKAQTSQAIRIAHILSSYLQLHSPSSSTSSVNTENIYSNYGRNLRPDPQLEEYIVVGEIISTILTNYPIQEISVFFNGTEFNRQKTFAIQNTLAFGVSAIKSDIELLLNRSNDDSHISKSWYKDAINRFIYNDNKTAYAGIYNNEIERNYFQSVGALDASSKYKIDRYGIEMSLRKSFDGIQGNNELPVKYYDAASSGVWFGPYYDCQKRYIKTKTTLRMSYNVPIITSASKQPV